MKILLVIVLLNTAGPLEISTSISISGWDNLQHCEENLASMKRSVIDDTIVEHGKCYEVI